MNPQTSGAFSNSVISLSLQATSSPTTSVDLIIAGVRLLSATLGFTQSTCTSFESTSYHALCTTTADELDYSEYRAKALRDEASISLSHHRGLVPSAPDPVLEDSLQPAGLPNVGLTGELGLPIVLAGAETSLPCQRPPSDAPSVTAWAFVPKTFFNFRGSSSANEKLKFLSNSGSEFTYIQCWCYYLHNQNDYICKSTFVRPETVSNEHFGFSLLVDTKEQWIAKPIGNATAWN